MAKALLLLASSLSWSGLPSYMSPIWRYLTSMVCSCTPPLPSSSSPNPHRLILPLSDYPRIKSAFNLFAPFDNFTTEVMSTYQLSCSPNFVAVNLFAERWYIENIEKTFPFILTLQVMWSAFNMTLKANCFDCPSWLSTTHYWPLQFVFHVHIHC